MGYNCLHSRPAVTGEEADGVCPTSKTIKWKAQSFFSWGAYIYVDDQTMSLTCTQGKNKVKQIVLKH